MFIKLCGMTRRQDVELAQNLGTDAVGFIFATSPRQVTSDQVVKLTQDMDGVFKVGVFVNEELEKVAEIRERANLDIIQLHGNESPDYCAQLGGRIFKAFRLKDAETIKRIADYPPNIRLLLDTYVKGRAGGTGKQLNRALLEDIADFSRIILAGGIAAEHIELLNQSYQPFGFDVNSSIETSPGIKDVQKMHRLFETIHSIKPGNE